MTIEVSEVRPANGVELILPQSPTPPDLAMLKLRQPVLSVAPKQLDGLRAIEFLAKTFPPIQERIKGLAPIEGLAIFVGADKSGKSLSLSQLGICIAAGKSWMDAAVEQCPVMLIEEEGSEHSLQARLERQIGSLGLVGVDLGLYVYHRTMLKLQDPTWINALEHEINATGARVVLISSLAQVGGIEEENDPREFNAIHEALRGLMDRTHVLVVIAHHRRKPTQDRAPVNADAFFNSVRGSSALMGAVDLAFGLLRGSEDPTGRMFYKGRDFPSRSWSIKFDVASLTFDLDWSATATKPDIEKTNILNLVEMNRGARMTIADIVARTTLPRTTVDRKAKELVAEGRVLSAQRGSGKTAPYEFWVDDPVAMHAASQAAILAAFP